MEIETLDELDDHLASDGPLRGLRLQDLDLTSYGDRLAARSDLTGLVVLGGTVPFRGGRGAARAWRDPLPGRRRRAGRPVARPLLPVRPLRRPRARVCRDPGREGVRVVRRRAAAHRRVLHARACHPRRLGDRRARRVRPGPFGGGDHGWACAATGLGGLRRRRRARARPRRGGSPRRDRWWARRDGGRQPRCAVPQRGRRRGGRRAHRARAGLPARRHAVGGDGARGTGGHRR